MAKELRIKYIEGCSAVLTIFAANPSRSFSSGVSGGVLTISFTCLFSCENGYTLLGMSFNLLSIVMGNLPYN